MSPSGPGHLQFHRALRAFMAPHKPRQHGRPLIWITSCVVAGAAAGVSMVGGFAGCLLGIVAALAAFWAYAPRWFANIAYGGGSRNNRAIGAPAHASRVARVRAQVMRAAAAGRPLVTGDRRASESVTTRPLDYKDGAARIDLSALRDAVSLHNWPGEGDD